MRSMIRLSVALTLSLLLVPIFAHASGKGGMRTSEACEVFNGGQLNCPWKKPLAATALESLKIRCKTDQAVLCQTVSPAKMTTCEAAEICREDANVGDDILSGCKTAVKEYGREAVENLKKKWRAYSACNTDLSEKRKMFSLYNELVPKILRREPLPDETLKEMNCSEVERVISGYSANIQQKMLLKLTRFETENPLFRGQLDSYPAELQDFKVWMIANSEKDFESLKKAAKSIANLPAKAFGLLEQLGINLSCYNAKARSEMICYGALSAIEMAGETALGLGALRGAKYMMMLADASGSAKVASAVIAMQKQEAIANAAAKIDPRNIRSIAKKEEKFEKAQASALKKSSVLNESERKRVAELMVNDGKTLTLDQADGLRRAHEVGQAESHGFHTYTKAELKEKFKILTSSGFSESQTRRLLRNGIAGEFASAAQTTEALQKFGARERDAVKADSYAMLEDAGKVSLRGGRALGTAEDAAARIAIDHQIKQLEALAARSTEAPGIIAQIDEVKVKLLKLQGYGAGEMAKVETKALIDLQTDLNAKLRANGYNGYSKAGPDGFTAEKKLADAIEKELEARPEWAIEKKKRMEQLQVDHMASELKKQIDFRNTKGGPAGKPFDRELANQMNHDIELLNGDPTHISKTDLARLRELKARAEAGAAWSGGGYTGLVVEDQRLVTRFANAWNSAAAKVESRRTSIQNLAAKQGRTLKSKMVYQKSTQFGPGPSVERVVSRKAELMAAEDSTKILDSLKAVQNSRFSPSAMVVEYKPVITSASDLLAISERLAAVNVAPRMVEAANALSTLDVTVIAHSPDAYREAKELLLALNRDGNLTRISAQLDPQQATALRNLRDTIQFYVDHDVPSHLEFGRFH